MCKRLSMNGGVTHRSYNANNFFTPNPVRTISRGVIALGLFCAASVSNAGSTQAQYDAVMSICKLVVHGKSPEVPQLNKLHPHSAATAYFRTRGETLDSNEPSRITLLEDPGHGTLTPYAKFPKHVFIYHPRKSYLGPDQMVFAVEAKGKKLKVLNSVYVEPTIANYGHASDNAKKACPDVFHIKELPNSGKK